MNVIAIYAAVVATGGFAWQVWTWWTKRRLRCEVRTGLYAMLRWQGDASGLLIELVNRSDLPVRVTHAALRMQGGGAEDWLVPRGMWRGFELPFKVDARDSGAVMFDRQGLDQQMTWTEPVVAAVWLSTGERFESEPKCFAQVTQPQGALRPAA